MIIISIGGGLGNQMFEYAFYEMMKKQYPNEEIKLDIMHIFGPAHNGYEIEKIFQLHAGDCDLKELRKLSGMCPVDAKYYKFFKKVYNLRRKIFGSKKSCMVQEDFTKYYEEYFHLDTSKSYYLQGVYGNYRYFDKEKEYIQKIYTFPPIKDERNLAWQDKIKNTNSVSMHIRHGDYVAWGVELLSEDYYRTAMAMIEEQTGPCNFYVFTDDPEYVKETFKDKTNLEVVEGNEGANSYIDMQLMSYCKHNIIANSSFSFWGAYLNKNPDKMVIASKKPYTGCSVPFACDDWILI